MIAPIIADGLFGDVLHSAAGLLAISLVIAAALIFIGARIAGLKYVTIVRASIAALSASGAAWVCVTLFPDVMVPVLGVSLGAILGVFLSLFVIKEVLNTSVGPALLVWAFDMAAQVVAGLLGISVMGVQLLHLFR